MKASDFAGWLVVTAEASGWLVFSADLGAAFPTLTCCRDGELLFVHTKASTKPELTSAQQTWAQALSRAGVEAVCWTPSDMPTAYERLTEGNSTSWNGQRKRVDSSELVS